MEYEEGTTRVSAIFRFLQNEGRLDVHQVYHALEKAEGAGTTGIQQKLAQFQKRTGHMPSEEEKQRFVHELIEEGFGNHLHPQRAFMMVLLPAFCPDDERPTRVFDGQTVASEYEKEEKEDEAPTTPWHPIPPPPKTVPSARIIPDSTSQGRRWLLLTACLGAGALTASVGWFSWQTNQQPNTETAVGIAPIVVLVPAPITEEQEEVAEQATTPPAPLASTAPPQPVAQKNKRPRYHKRKARLPSWEELEGKFNLLQNPKTRLPQSGLDPVKDFYISHEL